MTKGGAKARTGSLSAYQQLYTDLWAPIARWLPANAGSRVTVVPHGPLFACPFAALRDARGRYLIERHTLHYAGSGAVLLEAAERAAQTAPDPRALVVADPVLGARNPRLASLPAARAEARAIERTLAMPSDVLVGAAASEPRVRELLPSASVAHFATHALVRDDDPLGSHLVLGRGGDGSNQDGELSASEVAAMTTRARLVVLGACRSARGPVSSDGIAGLTRAFMAAGAPSVVATLWDVVDEPTSRLMRGFYRAYADGRPRDEALRSAQLAVLKDLRAGRIKTGAAASVAYPEHPWLWAGAILVGAP
jgi:CHAT domain-containing protein